jgi:hypothetical protein
MRVSIRTAAVAGTLALTFLGWVHVAAQAGDAGLGTWKQDVATAKYSPDPPPKSQTVKYEVSGDSFKRTIDTVDAQGQSAHTEVIFKYDGKEYPVKGATPPQTLTFKRIDDRTTEIVSKVNGKVTQTTHRALSRDGKTANITQTGMNAQGQKINNTFVLTKQ